jgi:hypothetical protein
LLRAAWEGKAVMELKIILMALLIATIQGLALVSGRKRKHSEPAGRRTHAHLTPTIHLTPAPPL